MRIDIATLFPDMCQSVLDESIIGRARKENKVEINCKNIRDYAFNKHKQVDDTPYGGGHGMVMQAEPIALCIEDIAKDSGMKPHVIFMTAAGQTLTQKRCKELSQLEHIVLVCGHYEGIDERVLQEYGDEELSIGDYVLTGGELAALVVADSVSRMCEGVLSSSEGYEEESHYNGLLEYPQYTRPEVWRGIQVPKILLSGHHANIEKWRSEQSKERTLARRPDMMEKYLIENPPAKAKVKRKKCKKPINVEN